MGLSGCIARMRTQGVVIKINYSKSAEIIPPGKSSTAISSKVAGDLSQPISALRSRLEESSERLPTIAKFSVGIKKAIAIARVANYETDVMAKGAMAIIEQHVNSLVDDARKRFFISRSAEDAELRTAVLEYTTRAQSTLASLVHDSNGSIFKTKKRKCQRSKLN